MVNDDIISMPDKWEYPWYAAWDLAFHTHRAGAWSIWISPSSSSNLMLRELYLHPNGQIPAYEWNFSDVNPPVHAWATISSTASKKTLRGKGDVECLKTLFPQAAAELHLVGQPQGPQRQERLRRRLPRAGQYRRLRPQLAAADRRLSGAGRRHGLDGFLLPEHAARSPWSWRMHDPSYEDMALKFFEHFLWIAAAMDRIGDNQDELWDEAGWLLLRPAALARRRRRRA